jgi:hypothetical protein
MLTSAFNHLLTKFVTWTEGTKENKGLQQFNLNIFKFSIYQKMLLGSYVPESRRG